MVGNMFSRDTTYIEAENFFKETIVLLESELDYNLKVEDGFYIDDLNNFTRVADIFVDRNNCTTYKLIDKVINDDESWSKAVECKDELKRIMNENENLKQKIKNFNNLLFFEKIFKKIKI